MKHLSLIVLAVAITACSKDKRSVEFGVTCGSCQIAYVTPENEYAYVSLSPHYTYTFGIDSIITAADTIITGMDTVIVAADTALVSVAVDSSFVGGPYSWSFSGTYAADVNPKLRAENSLSPSTTTAFRIVDGKRDEGSSSGYRGLVEFP